MAHTLPTSALIKGTARNMSLENRDHHLSIRSVFEYPNAFIKLAEKLSAQGSGLGRALTKALFANVNSKTAILLTHQSTTIASEMYLRNGWVRLNENFEVSPGKYYQIMGKSLISGPF